MREQRVGQETYGWIEACGLQRMLANVLVNQVKRGGMLSVTDNKRPSLTTFQRFYSHFSLKLRDTTVAYAHGGRGYSAYT